MDQPTRRQSIMETTSSKSHEYREPVFDELHHYVFLKAELFWACVSQQQAKQKMLQIIHQAQMLFQSWLLEDVGQPVVVKQTVQEDGSVDLCAAGIELGSYGVRRHPCHPLWYVYATALAEPRYGYVVETVSSD